MRLEEKDILRFANPSRLKFPGLNPEEITNSRKSFQFQSKGPTIITDNIMIGSRDDSQSLDILQSFGITHILNVAAQLPNLYLEHFIYEKIDLIDSSETDINIVMPKILTFLRHVEKVNGRVLIHCVSGISRSVCVLLMFLIIEHKLLLRDSYEYLKSQRPHISPNEGFKLQLALCEVKELGCSSVSSDAGPDWNFYSWNSVKHSYPKYVNKSVACILS